MSRQNQKPRLAIVPDDISNPPGPEEAAEIRRLYDISNAGIRAFVMMGFRLIDVKSRLPHGQYMTWLESHLAELTSRHLHRSRQIAEAIALHLEWDASNWTRVSNLTTLPAEVCDLIDGKSGRALLADLREPLSPTEATTEAMCQAECEKMWKASAEKRDDWEPRVLSGELTYHRALTGMLGNKLTAGQAKEAVRHNEVMETAADKLQKHLAHFEALPPLAQASVVEHLTGMAAAMPQACREAMLEVWKGEEL